MISDTISHVGNGKRHNDMVEEKNFDVMLDLVWRTKPNQNINTFPKTHPVVCFLTTRLENK